MLARPNEIRLIGVSHVQGETTDGGKTINFRVEAVTADRRAVSLLLEPDALRKIVEGGAAILKAQFTI